MRQEMDLICPTAQDARAPDGMRQIGTTGSAQGGPPERIQTRCRVNLPRFSATPPDHHCLKCKVDHTRIPADRANHCAYFDVGVFEMTDLSLTATDISRPGSLLMRRGKRGLVALLLDALHQSRRLQAERTLQRYRHLIGPAQANILRELNARAEAERASG
jgi:hypothetical protein